MSDSLARKGLGRMNKSWFSKLTKGAIVRAAVLALVISPTLGLANTPHKTKGTVRHVVRQPASQAVQFQGQKSQADWDHDEDGFYRPTRSSGFNDLFGS
jgi:hypothetical protein